MKILQVPELSKWNKQKLKSQNEKKMKEKKKDSATFGRRKATNGGKKQIQR